MKIKIGLIILLLALSIGIGLWAIGKDWRAFLASPPTDTNVLFWSHEQRTNTFRMIDTIPLLASARDITVGSHVRLLAQGDPLNLDFDFDTYFKQQNHAAVVVIHNGAIRLQEYGLGFTDEGRWTSFSVAKSITSTLVGAAIKDGSIKSLDDKVSHYIPELKDSAYANVSIEQLLTMTSGIAWNEDYNDPKSDVARFNKHESDENIVDLVDYMRQLPAAHTPGSVWNYSTGETNLIGILIANATGVPLAEYLSTTIWQLYGMQQKATWIMSKDKLEISGCCIQASTLDFARYGQFMLEGAKINGQSIVPDNWIASATQKQVDYGVPSEGYGYQWWTKDDGSYSARGIFGQGIFIDPSRQLVIASNSSWTQAIGVEERTRLALFYKAVQDAIDNEANQ